MPTIFVVTLVKFSGFILAVWPAQVQTLEAMDVEARGTAQCWMHFLATHNRLMWCCNQPSVSNFGTWTIFATISNWMWFAHFKSVLVRIQLGDDQSMLCMVVCCKNQILSFKGALLFMSKSWLLQKCFQAIVALCVRGDKPVESLSNRQPTITIYGQT